MEVPLALRRDLSGGRIVLEPEEPQFSVNYSLLAELLSADQEDLQDRLTDLANLVPNFPIDPNEFHDFWTGFRMIATGVSLTAELPRRSRGAGGRRPVFDHGDGDEADTDAESLEAGEAETDAESLQASVQAETACSEKIHQTMHRLQLVDFYRPQIPADGKFRLLPATAVILGRRAGHELSVLEELRQMAAEPLERTAFGSLFDPSSARIEPSRSSETALEQAFPLPLTVAQEAVVRSARTAPLTVVTGPPGTGKSYTITAIVLDQLLRGQTVLMASQMDKAVEVVAAMTERVAGPFAMARSGGRAAQRELAAKITRLTGPKADLIAITATERGRVVERHRQLSSQLAAFDEQYQSVVECEWKWSQSSDAYRRLAPISPLPIHEVTRRTYQKAGKAVERADRFLQENVGTIGQWYGRWQFRRAMRLLRVPRDWPCSLGELREALRVHEHNQTVQEAERRLRTPLAADSVWAEISRVEKELAEQALRLLKMDRQAALFKLTRGRRDRQQLRDLRTLLRRRNRRLKQALRERISRTVLLEAFPAWSSTNRTLGQILPLEPALFDLVVLDEASQCDLATAAAALFRARRAVIVGDPQQLRHVCFLGRAREQAAFVRHGISPEVQDQVRYSQRSLFDVAADAVSQDHFFLLDEHFRCEPHIISFSNRQFYDGQLRIMTERPRRQPRSSIRVVPAGGRRLEGSSVNPAEVETVLGLVEEIVRKKPVDASAVSLGIVCPFRDQVEAILERLSRRFSAAELDRHAMVVGTAHSLQGDEKDIVLLSTSIDPHYHPASLRFLENPNLFNVAVTRARRELIVVTSVTADNLPAGLLREFLLHAEVSMKPHAPTGECQTELARSVATELRERGFDLWPNFYAAGFTLDLVAGQQHRCLAIVCDSLERRQEPAEALSMQRILSRAGWKLSRLPHRSWTADRFACAESLGRQLVEQGAE